MEAMHCNATGCGRIVVTYRPVDLGLALVLCVEHATDFLATGGLTDLAAAGFTGELKVHPSREDA